MASCTVSLNAAHKHVTQRTPMITYCIVHLMALDTPLTYGITMTIAQLSSPFILFNTTLTLLTLRTV